MRKPLATVRNCGAREHLLEGKAEDGCVQDERHHLSNPQTSVRKEAAFMDSPTFPPQFHPIVTAWFQKRFGEPSPPQRQGWPLIAARKHTLILAPTGSGKTLAAFLACLDALIHELLAAQGSGVGGQGASGKAPAASAQPRSRHLAGRSPYDPPPQTRKCTTGNPPPTPPAAARTQ